METRVERRRIGATRPTLGIDLTASVKRPSAFAVLGSDGAFLESGTAASGQDILKKVLDLRARLVGMDCPLGLPAGLCCLEERCDCAPTSPLKGREGERELARRGIPCYFTTKRSIIKAMVYRGMALKRSMEGYGVEVIEVYPYAAKVAPWGKPIPKKTSAEGMEFLHERLCGLVPGFPVDGVMTSHDLADAVLVAHTAYLRGQGWTEDLGLEDEAFIVMPRKG